MKPYLFYKSIVLTGNFLLLALFLFYLQMIPFIRFVYIILFGLLTTISTALLSSILCSTLSEKQEPTSTLFLKFITWTYLVLFLSLGIFLSIGIKDHEFLSLSSTLHAFNSLASQSNKQINRPISPGQLFWENTKLIVKQSFYGSDYQLRTTKLLGYNVSFFNYKTLHLLFQEIFLNNLYHFTTTQQPFIIDCGSNIGISILFFKTIYPQAKIICFEPDPTTFSVLKINIEANNLTDIRAINKAIAESDGTLPFYFNSNKPGHLCMSTSASRACVIGKQTQMVQATKLSHFINQPVDFLKLDIEGAETSVIMELAHEGKLALINQMVIEFHPSLFPDAQDTLPILLKTLHDSNFIYQISTGYMPPFKKGQPQGFMIFAYKK